MCMIIFCSYRTKSLEIKTLLNTLNLHCRIESSFNKRSIIIYQNLTTSGQISSPPEDVQMDSSLTGVPVCAALIIKPGLI